MSALLHTPAVEPATADHARALHLRRQLEAAAEHGAAMLAALGLPGLDALDEAIRVLDELDGDSEAEPYLAGDYTPGLPLDAEGEPEHDEDPADAELVNEDGDELDAGEHDTADWEHTLGWNETVSQLELGRPCEDGDATAPERHGGGFIRSGPEDAEDDELGDDRDPEAVVWVFGPGRSEVARHG